MDSAEGTLKGDSVTGILHGSNEGGPRTWLSDGLAGSSDIGPLGGMGELHSLLAALHSNTIYHNQAFE